MEAVADRYCTAVPLTYQLTIQLLCVAGHNANMVNRTKTMKMVKSFQFLLLLTFILTPDVTWLITMVIRNYIL